MENNTTQLEKPIFPLEDYLDELIYHQKRLVGKIQMEITDNDKLELVEILDQQIQNLSLLIDRKCQFSRIGMPYLGAGVLSGGLKLANLANKTSVRPVKYLD